MKRILTCLIAVLSLLGTSRAADTQPLENPNAFADQLEPVHLRSIELGGFWKQQAKRLTEKWLPHCVHEMEKGGRGQELLNLVALGRVQRGEPVDWKYNGAPWSDAYVYNTVEAICLALAVSPAGDAELTKAQAQLRAKLDEWIPIILAAQAPDGYIHSFHVLNRHPRYSNVGWHEFYVMGYFYTAMTDMALLRGSTAYAQAVDRIWTNAIQKKHYLTGGVGASHKGEAFAGDFELPNDGYCESCAGCGLSFWADRMHRLHRDGHYRDVQERVLYNNLLGSVELAGENFFYQNPLDSNKARYPWHGCPCCVGNIPRALFAIKDMIYSLDPSRTELYLSHYVDCEATLPKVGGASLRVRQETRYPWEGDIAVTLHPAQPSEFTLKLRIPDRTESDLYSATPDLSGKFTLRVNGQPQSPKIERGYVALRRTWKAGDRVELSLPMEVQRVHCDARVLANRGRVALQRGPLVYNVEDVDNKQAAASLVLKPDLPLKAVWMDGLLGGVMAIEGLGITAVPNFARLNRGGASQVWLVENPAEVVKPLPKPGAPWPVNTAIQQRTSDFVAQCAKHPQTKILLPWQINLL
jgi:DUF1680 family protein